jgi:hypothetical protein
MVDVVVEGELEDFGRVEWCFDFWLECDDELEGGEEVAGGEEAAGPVVLWWVARAMASTAAPTTIRATTAAIVRFSHRSMPTWEWLEATA